MSQKWGFPTIKKKNSQAIFGTNSWSAAPLTTDHKPTQFHPSRSKKAWKPFSQHKQLKTPKHQLDWKGPQLSPNNKKNMSSLFPMLFVVPTLRSKSGSPARATNSGKAQVGEIPTFHLPSWVLGWTEWTAHVEELGSDIFLGGLEDTLW